MIHYKKIVNIACSDSRVIGSLSRFLKYCLGFEEIVLNPLSNPYRFRDAVKMAERCDLFIVDAFIDGMPKGLHFARQMTKKTLLLFYSGELDIDIEGPFWLVLPYELCRLKKTIENVIQKAEISFRDYQAFEEKFPRLKENSSHHN